MQDKIEQLRQAPTVLSLRRKGIDTAIVTADTATGPAPNAVEIAADHGADVEMLREGVGKAVYRVAF